MQVEQKETSTYSWTIDSFPKLEETEVLVTYESTIKNHIKIGFKYRGVCILILESGSVYIEDSAYISDYSLCDDDGNINSGWYVYDGDEVSEFEGKVIAWQELPSPYYDDVFEETRKLLKI